MIKKETSVLAVFGAILIGALPARSRELPQTPPASIDFDQGVSLPQLRLAPAKDADEDETEGEDASPADAHSRSYSRHRSKKLLKAIAAGEANEKIYSFLEFGADPNFKPWISAPRWAKRKNLTLPPLILALTLKETRLAMDILEKYHGNPDTLDSKGRPAAFYAIEAYRDDTGEFKDFIYPEILSHLNLERLDSADKKNALEIISKNTNKIKN
jgi:hypothetical protein